MADQLKLDKDILQNGDELADVEDVHKILHDVTKKLKHLQNILDKQGYQIAAAHIDMAINALDTSKTN